MNRFNWLKAIGFGVLLWAVMAVVLWMLVSFSFLSASGTHWINAIIFGVVAYAFALSTKPENATQALAYGAVWVAVGMVLDLLIMQNYDAHTFTSWSYWVGYALVLFAPLLRVESPSGKTVST